MALYNCPECGREISTEAKTCPGCGAKAKPPKPPKKPTSSLLKWLLGISVVGSIAIGQMNQSEQRAAAEAEQKRVAALTPEQRDAEQLEKAKVAAEAAKKAAEEAEQQRKLDNAIARAAVVASKLRSAMRNPDSFSLESVRIADNGTACFKYRAQNGFGGMNVEEAILTDKDFKTGSDKGFAKLYNKECTKPAYEEVKRVKNML